MAETMKLQLRTDTRFKPAGLTSGKIRFSRDASGEAKPVTVSRAQGEYLLRTFPKHLEVVRSLEERAAIARDKRAIELPPEDDEPVAPAPAAKAKPKAAPAAKEDVAAAKSPEDAAAKMAAMVGLTPAAPAPSAVELPPEDDNDPGQDDDGDADPDADDEPGGIEVPAASKASTRKRGMAALRK